MRQAGHHARRKLLVRLPNHLGDACMCLPALHLLAAHGPLQLAGMPNPVVLRANDILHLLEREKHHAKNKQKLAELPKPQFQMSLFEADPKMKAVHDLLSKIDINTISPVEALLKLNEVLSVLKK